MGSCGQCHDTLACLIGLLVVHKTLLLIKYKNKRLKPILA